jgi:hypothetical protein
MVVFEGGFQQCSPMVSKVYWATINSTTFSCSVLWREVHVLTLVENMKLRANPLSRLYAEYLLKIDNGQEFSIIDHFPLEVEAEPRESIMQTKDTWTVELF